MKVLVIDRDALAGQLIASKLGGKGHTVVVEPNKNAAFDMLRQGGFDCVMIDPAPLSEARPVIIGVWKNMPSDAKPYLFLLSKNATSTEAVASGTNDVLLKPLDSQDLEQKITNAQRLLDITRQLAVEDDAHSGGGMIGKAAFHQLFLSAIDRASRYGERSLVTFAEISNYDDIAALGDDALQASMAKLNEKLTFMRRQSDVIGRLSVRSFGILLQRPQYESEPIDAINRFAEVLDKFHHSFEDRRLAPKISLRLIELPQGAQIAERAAPLADAITLESAK